MQTFEVVNNHFKNFFTSLSSKGEATMVIESPQDPFEAGLLIKVKITGTRFLDIRSLSGGEKTSVALSYRLALNKVINDLIGNIKTKNIIILDEPTYGFSSEQLDKVREVF